MQPVPTKKMTTPFSNIYNPKLCRVSSSAPPLLRSGGGGGGGGGNKACSSVSDPHVRTTLDQATKLPSTAVLQTGIHTCEKRLTTDVFVRVVSSINA